VTNVRKPARAPVASTVSEPIVKPAVAKKNTAEQSVSNRAPSAHPVSDDWREIVESLGLGGLVKQLAINCTMKQRDDCNIVLQIATGHSNLVNAKAKQRLQQAIGEYFNIDAKLEIEVTNQIEHESPAQTFQREASQRQKQAEQAINEDSFTQTLKEKFNAEIIPGSVKPVA
jgi:DNA polymerase-3 subunit gamma/tau